MASVMQANRPIAPLFDSLAQRFDEGLTPVNPKKLSRIGAIWNSFGWSDTNIQNLPQNHFSSVMFLKNGGVLFGIRAYQQSLAKAVADFGRVLVGNEEKLLEGIHLDRDGHPMILKEGEWTRCDQIQQELAVNPDTKVMYSKDNPDIHWSYSYPDGLVQVRDDEFLPCYKLSQREVTALKERSHTEQNYFFQVFTSGNTPGEQFDHTSCRLINAATGEVYSFGLGRPEEQGIHGIFSQFAVFDTKIYSSPDFREFARFSTRRVTTLSLEEAKFQELVVRVLNYVRDPISFHFAHQNCTTFTTDLLRIAGHDVEIMCSLPELVSDLYPEGIEGIAYVGTVYAQIQGIVKPIFAFIHSISPEQAIRAFDHLVVIVLFIPNKTMTAILNIFIITLGGTAAAFPLREAAEDTIDNRERLTAFSRWMSLSVESIFNEPMGASPIKIAQWQRNQETTVTHPYAQGPMFNVVPPIA